LNIQFGILIGGFFLKKLYENFWKSGVIQKRDFERFLGINSANFHKIKEKLGNNCFKFLLPSGFL
jgi:hypothetical protein